MDNAINQANNTPGLTVNRDADYQTTKNSDDYSGINFWQDDTKGLYSRETDAIKAAIAKQRQNNREYDNAIAQLTSEQHTTGTMPVDNGGFLTFDTNYNVSWHYDLSKQAVIVDSVNMNINRKQPIHKGSGFWDVVTFTSPYATTPSHGGTFDSISTGDVPGIDGNTIWNEMDKNGLFGYIAQNNGTGDYVIKYGNPNQPFTAKYVGNGNWQVLIAIDRLNDHSDPHNTKVIWGHENVNLLIHVPTRKTTSISYHYNKMNVNSVPDKSTTVHYHYNTFAIDLHFPNNIDDLSI